MQVASVGLAVRAAIRFFFTAAGVTGTMAVGRGTFATNGGASPNVRKRDSCYKLQAEPVQVDIIEVTIKLDWFASILERMVGHPVAT